MRVGIVGAGLQGRRRAAAVAAHPRSTLVAVAGRDPGEAAALAEPYGARALPDWSSLVARPDLDAVIVCTPPDSHAVITTSALAAGRHVLCEKPLARTTAEAAGMVTAARANGRILWCGWNHRFHPAVAEALRLVPAGAIGKPVSGRGVYGIGARPGYSAEWRADPTVAAGGHLMEQGIHLLDLFGRLAGDIVTVAAMTQSAVVDMGGLEDSAFVLMRTAGGVPVSVHTSLTEWINRFTLELTGTEGHLRVDGLGGAYGTETLRVCVRDPDGPFTERVSEYRRPDPSWAAEWAAFVTAAQSTVDGRGADGADGTDGLDGADGLAAMAVVEAAYESARTGRFCPVEPVDTLLRTFGGSDA